jgi:hypothetical protein
MACCPCGCCFNCVQVADTYQFAIAGNKYAGTYDVPVLSGDPCVWCLQNCLVDGNSLKLFGATGSGWLAAVTPPNTCGAGTIYRTQQINGLDFVCDGVTDFGPLDGGIGGDITVQPASGTGYHGGKYRCPCSFGTCGSCQEAIPLQWAVAISGVNAGSNCAPGIDCGALLNKTFLPLTRTCVNDSCVSPTGAFCVWDFTPSFGNCSGRNFCLVLAFDGTNWNFVIGTTSFRRDFATLFAGSIPDGSFKCMGSNTFNLTQFGYPFCTGSPTAVLTPN